MGMLAFGDSFPAPTLHALENRFSQDCVRTTPSFPHWLEESPSLCARGPYKGGSMAEVSILLHVCSVHVFLHQTSGLPCLSRSCRVSLPQSTSSALKHLAPHSPRSSFTTRANAFISRLSQHNVLKALAFNNEFTSQLDPRSVFLRYGMRCSCICSIS